MHSSFASRRVPFALLRSLPVILAALSAVALVSVTAPASAQTQAPAEKKITFEIAPGPLAAALNQLAEAGGVQFLYSSELSDGIRTKGLRGTLSVQEGIAQLLAGSGLTYRFIDTRTVAIEKLPAKGTRTLGPVRVEGASSSAVAGVNGSGDATATEGTGSYTSGALSIGSKAVQSLRETPQSVSVVTQQRMQDQNLHDLASLMEQATGISRVAEGAGQQTSNVESTYYSRGFAITNVQIDGGAPMNISGTYNFIPLIDMAQYDHVEVLRGVDGLFNGTGSPGGAINLVRKRALDHGQVVAEGAVGSWGRRRVMLDGTTPLGFAGRLRGRAVLTYDKQDYFYEIANKSHNLAFGTLELDATDSTLLTLGGSYTKQETLPWFQGLPRYSTGDDLHLARDTCLCLPWNRWNFQTSELFVQAEQALWGDWSGKLKVMQVDQSSARKYATVGGTISPTTGLGLHMNGSKADFSSVQRLADLTFQGSFELWGNPQRLVVGFNRQDVDASDYVKYGFFGSDTSYSFDSFDPAVFPEPADPAVRERLPALGQQQSGAYASLNLTLFSRLHIPLGIRYMRYRSEYYSESLRNGVFRPGTVRSTKGSDVSTPDLALAYDVTREWTAYASYASIYLLQNHQLDINREPMGPITGSNWEGGVKGELRDGRLNLSLAAFRTEQRNFNTQDPDVPYEVEGSLIRCCFISFGRDFAYVSQGVELEATGEVRPGLQVSAGYTWNKNETEGERAGARQGLPLNSRLPQHLVKLWANYRPAAGLLRGWTLGVGANAQSKGYYTGDVCTGFSTAPDGLERCATSVTYNFSQGAYAVFAGSASYSLNDRWVAALNITNITDRTYYQTVGTAGFDNWYGEPRGFVLTLRGRL